MANLGDDDGTAVEVVISQTENELLGHLEQPLLVAMQPGIDVSSVEIQEVVVFPDGNEANQAELHHAVHVDASTGHVVAVGAIEEVNDEVEVLSRQISVSDIKASSGRTARARKESTSSGDSDSEASSSDDEDRPPHSKKTPKKRDFAHRLQWRNKDMLEAMRAVDEKKMTIRGAAKKFAVPYSTLKDRVHGRVRHGTKPGVKTALSPEEEEELVRYVKDMETAGFQMKCVDVRDRAGELLRLNHGHNSPYKEGSPGHNWLAGFLKRHPDIEFKRSVTRHIVPSMAKQKTMVKKFFEIAGSIFRRHRLHTKSDRIYSVTECRVKFFPEATILLSVSADGSVLPPFVVFRGQRIKVTSARQVYPEAFFTCSYTGRVNEDIFLWWFRDHFLKKVSASGNRPLVLYLNRPVNDISLQLAQLAKEERIMLVSIPPGVSHLLQPLDEEMTRHVETMIAKRAKKWQDENKGQAVSQKALSEILKKVWRKGILPEEITRKFNTNGLYPLNSGAITMDRMLTATQFIRDAQQKSPSTPTSGGSSPVHLHGLSLLSALSSHEYASMEHVYDGQEGRAYDDIDNQEIHEEEVVTEVQMSHQTPLTHHQSPPAKRRRLTRREEEPSLPFEVSTPEMVLPPQHTGRGRRRSKVEERNDVKSELVAARDDVDQINRAIDSILQQEAAAAQSSSSRTTPRGAASRQNIQVIQVQSASKGAGETTLTAGDFDITKLDLARMQAKLEPGEVISEEVVQEEVVEEEEVKDYVPITLGEDGELPPEYVTVNENGTIVSADGMMAEQLVAVPAEEGGYQEEYVPVSGDGSVQQLIEMVHEEVVQDGDGIYHHQHPQQVIEAPVGEDQFIEVPFSSVLGSAENTGAVTITAQPQQRTPLSCVGNSVETLYINGQQVKVIRAQPNLIQQLRQQGMNVHVEHVSDTAHVQPIEQEYLELDPSQVVIDGNHIITEEEDGELVQECIVQDSYILDDSNVQEVVLEEQVH